MGKKYFAAVAAGIAALVITGSAQAALVVDGTVMLDGINRQLIYDDDKDITWLDYRHTGSGNNWNAQVSWAADLSVTTDTGMVLDNWRLPITEDGLKVVGSDGNTTAGYNITNSEMGHLFYEELHNIGLLDTKGNRVTTIFGLETKAPFTSLLAGFYWSGTEYGADQNNAWFFATKNGNQDETLKSLFNYNAIAVMPGRTIDPPANAVPVPAPIFLLGTGLAGLLGLKKRRRGQ